MTMGASFSLVPHCSQFLSDNTRLTSSQAAVTSQLLLPGAIQFVSTPLHLLGLDIYNNAGKSAEQRAHFVWQKYGSSVAARQLRIGFAFGVGGLGNNYAVRK